MYQGIILQTYLPISQKFALFDKQIGRIDGLIKNNKSVKKLFPGALINYNLEEWRSQYKISDIELIAAPAGWAQHDLLFVHHVLELCYYFLPLHSNAQALFDLLQELYQPKKVSYKKFLCRFFQKVGIYPAQPTSFDQQFLEYIFLTPLDMTSTLIDSKIEKSLQKWLHECVSTHTYANQLKTIHFLKKLNEYE